MPRCPSRAVYPLRHSPSAGVLAALALLAAAPAGAQQPMAVPRLEGTFRMDGRSDEPAWQAVAALPLAATRPVEGAPPSERTELRLAHDDDFLYLAARLYDRDPSGIQTRALERDGAGPGDDRVGLLLDTFDDGQSALVFVVTAAGARTDFTIQGDGRGHAENRGWNAEWDAAVARDDEGWYAEVRIPFSSLGFQAQGGAVSMGAVAFREIPRRAETVAFPTLPHEWLLRPSRAADIRLEGVSARRPLRLTPYALGGLLRQGAADAGLPLPARSELTHEAGLDVKYGLTPGLTLDVTLNTDFAQVEADDAVVNLSRFALFLPEKRRFFLERAGVFDFQLGWGDRAFHSRVIGVGRDGRPERILGGARLVGRLGGWDVGVLDMHTAPDGGAGENFGVARVRRSLANPDSWVGAIATTRIGAGGTDALLGADASLRVRPSDDVRLAVAQRVERGAAGTERSRVWLGYVRSQPAGLSFEANLIHAGTRSAPPVGFASRTGFTQVQGWGSWAFTPADGSAVQRWGPNAWGSLSLDAGGALESADVGANVYVRTRAGTFLRLWGGAQRAELAEPFALPGGARVPAGSHGWVQTGVNWAMPPGNLLRAAVWAQAGGFYDGRRISVGVEPEWSLSPRLTLSGRLERSRIRFPVRGQGVDADIARLRIQASATPSLSGGLLVQYNRASGALGGSARVRYNFGEGRDLYLVYDERVDTTLPGAGLTSEDERRSIMLKYAYTFGW